VTPATAENKTTAGSQAEATGTSTGMLTTAAMLAAVGTPAIVASNLANHEASKVVFLHKS
jgi:hypothetical protein